MNGEYAIKRIQNFIAKDNLEEAILMVIAWTRMDRNDLLDEALMLSRDNQSLKKAVRQGRLKWLDEDAQKRAIAFRLLELLKEE